MHITHQAEGKQYQMWHAKVKENIKLHCTGRKQGIKQTFEFLCSFEYAKTCLFASQHGIETQGWFQAVGHWVHPLFFSARSSQGCMDLRQGSFSHDIIKDPTHSVAKRKSKFKPLRLHKHRVMVLCGFCLRWIACIAQGLFFLTLTPTPPQLIPGTFHNTRCPAIWGGEFSEWLLLEGWVSSSQLVGSDCFCITLDYLVWFCFFF